MEEEGVKTKYWHRLESKDRRKRSVGRPPKFKTVQALEKACDGYFDEADENPIRIQKTQYVKGKLERYWEHLPRPYLLTELCVFLGIDETTWRDWRKNRAEFSPLITRVESRIYTQKLQGAFSNQFNANIVALDLGMKSKIEHSLSAETHEQFLRNLEEDDDE